MPNTMSRRAFLGLKQALTQAEDVPFRGVMSGLDPYTGNFKEAEIYHLLRRTMFGVTPADVAIFTKMSPSQAVDFLLQTTPAPAPPINNYSVSYQDYEGTSEQDKKLVDKTLAPNDKYVKLGDTFVDAAFDLEVEYYRNMSLKGWWLDSLIHQTPNIHEKMTFFWSNHIPIQMFLIYDARFSYKYLMTLRNNALGNFKTIIKEISIDPGMLFYLNGTFNDKNSPDENYARELQELFCVGKESGSKYTEDDVKAAARVLTGWKSEYNKPNTYFQVSAHDYADKKFSAFYNNTVIKGKTGDDGKKELDEMIDMIFAANETAKHLCRKLYRYFVYSQIDDTTEQIIIAPLADLLRKSNYDVKPVLGKLLKSQHFFDVLNQGAMLKTPLEYVVGLCRNFKVKFPAKTDYANYHNTYASLYYWTNDMLQAIGDPPNVAGWPAWYQKPALDHYWINTASLPKRAQNADTMLYWGYGTWFMHEGGIDLFEFTKTLKNPSTPNGLIDEMTARMSILALAPEVKTNLRNILTYNQAQDYYWTNAWNEYLAAPTDEMKKNNIKWRLADFYRSLFQLEEYQLM
jgi:uncharacterized protein (DUF1800 family)